MADGLPLPETELNDLLQRGFRFAFSLCSDEDRARDLLQDACLAISRNGGPWHRGYLFAAIRNRLIDLMRREGRASFLSIDSAPDDGDSGFPELCTPPSSDPADIVCASDNEVQHAIDRLAPGTREVLFLHLVEGFTAREIAELSGRPRNTILSLIHRGLKQARVLLASHERSPQP